MSNDARIDSDARLDRAIDAVSRDMPSAEAVEAAGHRVWQSVSEAGAGASAPLAACADFQALASDYVSGDLPRGRAALLEDHIISCAACRKTVEGARAAAPDAAAPATAKPRRVPARLDHRQALRPFTVVPRVAWAAAAMALLAAGLAGASTMGWLPFGSRPALASVVAVDGALYSVEGRGMTAVDEGATVEAGDVLRTAKGARAVLRLADGSAVEMAERSGLSLGRRPGRTTVDLERGSVIVRAEDQGRGRLAVVTDDCVATVKGTLFAVSRGTAGSRVSVLAGEVDVADVDGRSTLGPGDQLVTGAGLPLVGLGDEVAWSGSADEYREIVAELVALQGEVRAAFLPGGRTSSRLLELVPRRMSMVVAMPNLGSAVAESQGALDRRLAESEALRSWWREAVSASGAEGDVRVAVQHLAAFSDGLGDEVLVAADVPGEDGVPAVVVMAEVRDAERFDAALEGELEGLKRETGTGGDVPLVVIDDPLATGDSTPTPTDGALYLWRGEDIVVAATLPELLAEVASSIARGGTGFAASSLGERIAEAYGRGVDWLLAAGLSPNLAEAMAGTEGDKEQDGDAAPSTIGPEAREDSGDAEDAARWLTTTGALDARYLVVSHTGIEGGARTEAALSFDGPRQGVAGWLAQPGPMGALRFVSQDALAAAAFVVADPTVMLADMLAIADDADPGANGARRTDADPARPADAADGELLAIAQEMAASLGGDIAVALDGPVLPVPSWVIVAEVYDPARLEAAVRRAVDLRNRDAHDAGEADWSISLHDGETSSWVLDMGRSDRQFHAVIAEGYLVAAPTRALVERAIRTARSGSSLATAEEVVDGIRRDGHLDVSALVYQNVAGAVSDLAGPLGSLIGPGDPAGGAAGGGSSGRSADASEGLPALDPRTAAELLDIGPTLYTVVALDDEIRLYGTGPTGLIDLPLLGTGGFGAIVPIPAGADADQGPAPYGPRPRVAPSRADSASAVP